MEALAEYKEIGVEDNQLVLANILNSKKVACLPVREKIEIVESALFSLDQVDLPVSHYFAEGLYIRQFTIPRSVMLTSFYHKTEQFQIMLRGKLSIVTEDGVIQVSAPYYGVSRAGLKKLAYAHEEVLWIDVHANPTNERDIDVLEKMLYANTYEELLQSRES